MKRIISFIIVTILYQICAAAQTQSLQVVYVTKDYSTETTPLCKELWNIYNRAVADKNQVVIFYQANLSNPLVVKVNTPDDNRQDMETFISSLVTKSETMVDPYTDLKGLVNILDKAEVRQFKGRKPYTNVKLVYYVTPTFWSLNFNESLISSVYFSVGMDESWAKDYMTMSIYHCASDGIEVDKNFPFGKRKLCGNQELSLLTY